MRILSSLAIAAVVLAATPALAAERSFPVGGFDRVRNDTPFSVRIHTGAAPSVRAHGSQRMLERLTVRVQGGELVITQRQGWFNWSSDREPSGIDINVPALVAATSNGPGSMAIDRIAGRTFAGIVNGPGNLDIGRTNAAGLELTLRGPGSVTAAGRANFVRLRVSGPGSVRAAKLLVRDADVAVDGPGSVRLAATGQVRGSVSGPGSLHVTGGARCAVKTSFPGTTDCR